MSTGDGLENWAGRRMIFGRAVAVPVLAGLVREGMFFAKFKELTCDYLLRTCDLRNNDFAINCSFYKKNNAR
jgi:hypothetical protein